MDKIKKFFQETSQEFKRVSWPSRSTTIRYTIVVVFLSLSLAAYLGFLDYIFVGVLENII